MNNPKKYRYRLGRILALPLSAPASIVCKFPRVAKYAQPFGRVAASLSAKIIAALVRVRRFIYQVNPTSLYNAPPKKRRQTLNKSAGNPNLN